MGQGSAQASTPPGAEKERDTSLKKRLSEQFSHTIVSRFVEYVAVMRFLLRAIWESSFKQLMIFAALALTQNALVFGSLYLLYLLVNSATAAFSAASQQVEVNEMFLLVGALFVTLVGVALATYGFMRMNLLIAANVERLSIRRALEMIVHLPRYGSIYANHFVGVSRISRVVSSDARYSGVAVRYLLRSVPDIALSIGIFVTMLWIEFWLTLLLIGLSAGLTLILYPTHRGIAAASRQLERTRGDQGKKVKGVIDAVDRMEVESSEAKERLLAVEEMYEFPGDSTHDFYRRLEFVAYGGLLAQLSGALVLSIAIVALLYQGITGTLDVAILFVYVAAARQLLTSLTTLSRSFVVISRFYPQLTRYFRFMWSATGHWPLMLSEEVVRTATYKEMRADTGDQAMYDGAKPLRPGLTYRVFARRGWTRSSGGALIDALGFSESDLARYEPCITFGGNCETPVQPRPRPARQEPRPLWRLFLHEAGAGSGAEPGAAVAETYVYFSDYRGKDLEPVQADMFIVLDPDNWLAFQTDSYDEAVSKVEEMRVREPTKSSDVEVEDMLE